MAKQRKANHPSSWETLSRKIHEAKVLLINITLFILLIATLLRILLHEAVPVFGEVLQKIPWF
jgi:hypothetical protein